MITRIKSIFVETTRFSHPKVPQVHCREKKTSSTDGLDGEGLVNAMRTKGIRLRKKKKKEPKIKEREVEDLRDGRTPMNREETERSCATFEGIDQSCTAARNKFVR